MRSFLGVCLLAICSLGADVTGIWSGQEQGRRGEPQDVAFRFQLNGQALTGKMFGDEFDLPIADGSISGDQIRFTVTTTNYYNNVKTTFVYTGTIKGEEMELVRERVPTANDRPANRPANDKAGNRFPQKQTIKLKRI
jgi:hypothetical protein